MRILHTADWHLGDRLGRIDRTQDLRRAVERVGMYCHQEHIDVLLVAGDLFSELARPDSLRDSIQHWQDVFREFLQHGGTILTLTGNHDNESFCQTLRHAMSLAAPLPNIAGTRIPTGRLYLATEPTLLRLPDRHNPFDVQFLLMPYPTPSRYLKDESSQKYSSPEEKYRRLETAFCDMLRRMQQLETFDEHLPTVLGAHINCRGASVGHSLFRISDNEDVVVDHSQLPTHFTYIALGHIHKPQCLGRMNHVRYSGSIERLDLGEKSDHKSVTILEIDSKGLTEEPSIHPLESTPIYELEIHNPTQEIEKLKVEYADALNDLVNIHLTYTAGEDNLEEVLRNLDKIFPRWYNRDWQESKALGFSINSSDTNRSRSYQEIVREYVQQELMNHPEIDQNAILEHLNHLLRELEP